MPTTRSKAKKSHAAGWTVAHVTHEALDQIGGIGTVLEGLMTSPVYQQRISRSILIGPLWDHLTPDAEGRIQGHGQVLYDASSDIDTSGLGDGFAAIERQFDVGIVYGQRHFDPPGQQRSGEAEFILIDVRNYNQSRLNELKSRLWERYGLESSRYEGSWDYEEYLRLAEPALAALQLLRGDATDPCLIFGHEYMGMPTCLLAAMDPQQRYRTVFHAHECASARSVVENHPGHDTMFYNLLREADRQGQSMQDIFPALHDHIRHGLISRSHACDAILAVGQHTRDELHFLSPAMRDAKIDVVFNGLPAFKVTRESKEESRTMLADYAAELVGFTPDLLMTHVTRPVTSKGLWRDVRVCEALEEPLARAKRRGVLFLLTSASGVRREEDVRHMEAQYGWPAQHRVGHPDLVGPEEGIWEMFEDFNRRHKQIRMVLVNQFGWSRGRIGQRLPAPMSIAHLRQAADVEFGMATYEPFGISPLEPLGGGAICVISEVCGCDGFVRATTGAAGTDNVISADFTRLPHRLTLAQLLDMPASLRDAVETEQAQIIAEELMRVLPWTKKDRHARMREGQMLVDQMGWDQIIGDQLMPVLERVMGEHANNQP